MRNLICFQNGPHQLAVNMEKVRSIHSATVLGLDRYQGSHKPLILIDGNQVPVLDLTIVLDQTVSPTDWSNRKVILLNDHNEPLALAVDHIIGNLTIDESDVHRLPPAFRDASTECFPHVLHQGETLLPVISPKALYDRMPPIKNAIEKPAECSDAKDLPEYAWSCEVPGNDSESPSERAFEPAEPPDCFECAIKSEQFKSALSRAIRKVMAEKLKHIGGILSTSPLRFTNNDCANVN